METKMIWANLACSNLERIRKFYNSLGFRSNDSMSNSELASFSFANNHFIINFFVPSQVDSEINGSIGKWKDQSEVLFSLQADSREKVDEWCEKVKLAGGTIVSEPQNYREGYTFCFADLDGHKFNVLYWPGM